MCLSPEFKLSLEYDPISDSFDAGPLGELGDSLIAFPGPFFEKWRNNRPVTAGGLIHL